MKTFNFYWQKQRIDIYIINIKTATNCHTLKYIQEKGEKDIKQMINLMEKNNYKENPICENEKIIKKR